MPSMVVTAHGGRGAGTSTGTYVVPKGVTIDDDSSGRADRTGFRHRG